MKQDNELSQMLRKTMDDTADELQKILPEFDMLPKQDDAAVKQALINLSPQGQQQLYQQFGQQEVMEFQQEFSRNRRW